MTFNLPVLVIAWNRPEHVLKLIDSLREIKPNNIYVVIDGPRPGLKEQDDVRLIEETKNCIEKGIDWNCNVYKLYREVNIGCGKSVSTGISWFFNHVEEGIILEDDCIPQPSFFKFCERLLFKYRNQDKVMHIGGHSLGVCHNNMNGDYYFSAYNHIWGWATWKRAWENYNFEIDEELQQKIIKNLPNYFSTSEESSYWVNQLPIVRGIDTWDFQWTYSIWAAGGISILPTKNLVENIGFGVTATHTKEANELIKNARYQDIDNLNFHETNKIEIDKFNDLQMSNSLFNINAAISPITSNSHVKLINVFKKNDIVNMYLNGLNIDVSPYFENIDEVKLYKCLETDYCFYYPHGLAGDGHFYSQLQTFSWYYMRWKWEHEQAAKLVTDGMSILEIGCAEGDFLTEIRNRNLVTVTGLELNKSAVVKATEKNLNVIEEFVEDHSKNNESMYDIVCSFEVLEHIEHVKDFIESSIRCLKPGGKMIIAVPNNDSFIKYGYQSNYLNMPPHHSGLWSESSLKNLAKYFDIKFDYVVHEPIQEYHKEWHNDLMFNLFNKGLQRLNLHSLYNKLPSLIQRIFNRIIIFILKVITTSKGHTIVAVFTKKETNKH